MWCHSNIIICMWLSHPSGCYTCVYVVYVEPMHYVCGCLSHEVVTPVLMWYHYTMYVVVTVVRLLHVCLCGTTTPCVWLSQSWGCYTCAYVVPMHYVCGCHSHEAVTPVFMRCQCTMVWLSESWGCYTCVYVVPIHYGVVVTVWGCYTCGYVVPMG